MNSRAPAWVSHVSKVRCRTPFFVDGVFCLVMIPVDFSRSRLILGLFRFWRNCGLV